MKKSLFQRALIALAVIWVAALAAATIVASRRGLNVGAYGLSTVVYAIGSLICHQLPERSLHFDGAQLPVCARCSGLYLGAAFLAGLTPAIDRPLMQRAWNGARVWLSAAALPTALTLFYEWGTRETPGNWIRFAAGFPLGAVVMLVILAGAAANSAVEIN